jgi:hypothetical protein
LPRFVRRIVCGVAMAKLKDDPYIHRVEQGIARYWKAMITINGERVTKAFFDSTHGGSENAQRLARQWLEEAKKIHGFVPFDRRWWKRAIDRRNKSGVNGVYRKKYSGRDCWIASFYVAKFKKKEWPFAIEEYGEERAFQLAVEKRQEMESFYAMDRPAFEAMYNAENPPSTRQKNEDSIPHISRVDTAINHAWYVRIMVDGKPYRRVFTDAVYGGKDAALEAAKVDLERVKNGVR